jgi:peptidoglycan hydrolase CwlO-like protein
MNRALAKHLCLSLLIASTVGVSSIVGTATPAEAAKTKVAKKVTITDRMQDLSGQIDAGQKANELTLDEATDLRKKMDKIKAKVDKCESKNGGTLTYADQNSIEKDLNKVSTKIFSKKLDKRVAKPGH